MHTDHCLSQGNISFLTQCVTHLFPEFHDVIFIWGSTACNYQIRKAFPKNKKLTTELDSVA